MEQKFLGLLKGCKSYKELCEKLGLKYPQRGKIERFVRDCGDEYLKEEFRNFKFRSRCFTHTKYSFDENLFLEEGRDFWYFIGYLLGDGCVIKREKGQASFVLMSTDGDFINAFRDVIRSNHRVTISRNSKRNKNHKDVFSIEIYSDKIYNLLRSKGVPLNKSHTNDWCVKFTNVDAIYLIRGLIDSDGCIFRRTDTDSPSLYMLSSSKLLLSRIKEFLSLNLAPVGPSVNKHKSIFELRLSGELAKRVFEYVYYPELNWDLKRKRKLGESMWISQNSLAF